MITELVVATATTIAYQRLSYLKEHKDEREIRQRFTEIMRAANSKENIEDDKLFEIIFIKKQNYGYYCKVTIPDGKSHDKLEKLKSIIEDNLVCLCELSKGKFSEYIDMKLITNPLNNLKYQVLPTKPYELFLGYKYSGEEYKLNMLKNTHLLIGGIRGSGKSREQAIMLTTLLKNHTENEVEVYLMELMKKDLKKYKNMKQVKMFCDTLEDCKLMLQRLLGMIEHRCEKIDFNNCENIYEYNKKARIKMKYVYIFADEYSLFMEDESDTNEEKEQKAVILDAIKKISKLGRSCGIFYVAGLQRSTITEISSLVKSQMCRLSFSQLSELDSSNIIGITDAKGLEQQECILFTGSEYIHLKTPYIDNKIISNTLGWKTELKTHGKDNERPKQSYHWHLPKKEEWDKIKNALRDITVHEDEELKEVAVEELKPMQYVKQKKHRNGVISLKDVNRNVNSER